MRIAIVEILDNHAAHRQANEMGTFGFQMIKQTIQIIRIITKFQGLRGIIACPVPTRVPGHGTEAITKLIELLVPIGAVTADAVKKHDQGPLPWAS